jgi:hypothetical protein
MVNFLWDRGPKAPTEAMRITTDVSTALEIVFHQHFMTSIDRPNVELNPARQAAVIAEAAAVKKISSYCFLPPANKTENSEYQPNECQESPNYGWHNPHY